MPVPRIILRTDAPEFTVIAVNKAYEAMTGTTSGAVINKSVFDLLSADIAGANGQILLKNAFHEAIQANKQIDLHDFEISLTGHQPKLINWCQIELLPIVEQSEKPSYLIMTARDTTSHVLSQRELQETQHREQQLHEEIAAANEELSATNEELNTTIENLRQSQESLQELNDELESRVQQRTADLLKAQATLMEQHKLLDAIIDEVPAGICVLKGPEMILETINKKLLQLWKRDKSIIGMPLTEIMPEIKDQEFPRLLNEVYVTGVPHSNFDAPAEIIIDGVRQTVYRDYSYTPLKNKDNSTHSIVAMTVDVTERTQSRLREQQLLEEQSAINEELSASNEELAVTNEELHEAQDSQHKLIDVLAKSESRFRNLIMEAPVAICVLKGSEMLVDAINSEGLKILGKEADIIGKSLQEALPENSNQPFFDLLKGVYRSGRAYYGNEVPAQFEHQGMLANSYFNFIFKPVKMENDTIDGIIIVASKVNDLVITRKEKESAETKLGLAIEAARMGSWYIDKKTKHLNYNSTLATLFGYEGTEPMTYDQAIAQVTEDYREKIVEEIEKAINDGGVYDVTYTQRRFNDGEVIWLRSLGKITQDEFGNHSIFSGVVMDVTEQKQDEQRKNDFIGMVSHELKTPLTSLSGYAQILHARARKNEDNFAVNALTKVTDQVRKMTAMINGFLNISRLESGKIHLNKYNFSLDELVQENIEEAALLTITHQIIFNSCQSVTIFADRDKIGSVISNMISNAVKYSPEGKQVEVDCKVIGSSAIISVKDQGMGISAEDIPKLFNRFYRVKSNQTQLISGFGIGLYLSAEIILHHNGRIWVESEPGEGSTFFFSLPVME